MAPSQLELYFADQLFHAADLPMGVTEHRFAPPRRWRFDFAWPELMVAVEVEGGTWNGGRHTRGSGFDKDCEKYAAAAIAGWRVLRVSGTHVRSGEALDWTRQLLDAA